MIAKNIFLKLKERRGLQKHYILRLKLSRMSLAPPKEIMHIEKPTPKWYYNNL